MEWNARVNAHPQPDPEVFFENEDNQRQFVLSIKDNHVAYSQHDTESIEQVKLVQEDESRGPSFILKKLDRSRLQISFEKAKSIKKEQCKKAGTIYRLKVTLRSGKSLFSQGFSLSKGIERAIVRGICPDYLVAFRPSKLWISGDFPKKFTYTLVIGSLSFPLTSYSVGLLKFNIPWVPDTSFAPISEIALFRDDERVPLVGAANTIEILPPALKPQATQLPPQALLVPEEAPETTEMRGHANDLYFQQQHAFLYTTENIGEFIDNSWEQYIMPLNNHNINNFMQE